jgi:hypothetical protein
MLMRKKKELILRKNDHTKINLMIIDSLFLHPKWILNLQIPMDEIESIDLKVIGAQKRESHLEFPVEVVTLFSMK